MSDAPLKLDHETRVYVRVALRDTLEAYELTDLLDVMADICQNNAEAARAGGRMGLSAPAWQLRADVLRAAAERLEQESSAAAGPDEEGPV
ncbi:MAG: hypothetical protein L0Z62_04245 [Gemmataceae bacterium]|nr:hypothetical protein [Gemmataceae bacterium]